MGDFVKISNSLNPLNFFAESSILGVWWDPKSASGSIRVGFELIDYTNLTFFFWLFYLV